MITPPPSLLPGRTAARLGTFWAALQRPEVTGTSFKGIGAAKAVGKFAMPFALQISPETGSKRRNTRLQGFAPHVSAGSHPPIPAAAPERPEHLRASEARAPDLKTSAVMAGNWLAQVRQVLLGLSPTAPEWWGAVEAAATSQYNGFRSLGFIGFRVIPNPQDSRLQTLI